MSALGMKPMGTSPGGPRGLSIKDTQIAESIVRAKNFVQDNSANVEVVKKEIVRLLDMEKNPFDVIMSMNSMNSNQTTNQTKISALDKLKQYGVKKFILEFDAFNSIRRDYASKIAYIQTLFKELKKQNPTDEWFVSYETPSPVEADMALQIDKKISELSKPGFFSILKLPFGGRKQKRTKKGGKKSKRKTKRHKKTRSRRR